MRGLIYSGLQAGFTSNAKLSAAMVRLQMLQLAAMKPANASSSSAALRQPSYSNSHLTPPCFDKYFTTERGHCPGAPGSTLKECANETTAQIAQRVEDEDPLTQLHPGKVQTERTAEMTLPAAYDTTAGCIQAIPGSCHPCSTLSLPFLWPEHLRHSPSLAHHPAMHWHDRSPLPFPPFQDTTQLPALPFEGAFI